MKFETQFGHNFRFGSIMSQNNIRLYFLLILTVLNFYLKIPIWVSLTRTGI